MPKVTLPKEKKEIEVAAGANLRESLQREGIEVYAGLSRYVNCFGHSMCGECRVLVTKGMENLSKPSLIENGKLATMLATLGNEKTMRLSCCCQVNGDVTVETRPELNLSGEVFWKKEYPNK
jgi:ferredoxin